MDTVSPEVELDQKDAEKFFNAPPPPSTVLEALEQRLEKYKQTMEEAKAKGDTLKVNRNKRIVDKYVKAIANHKAGKLVDYESLPTPPGFAEIPTKSAVATPPTTVTKPPAAPPSQPKADNAQKPPECSQQQPEEAKTQPTIPAQPHVPKRVAPKPPQRPQLKRGSSVSDKQLKYLMERQQLFKEAALESKKKGDTQQAIEYLRKAKGFEPLIEATKSGLPIDATSIPTPPQLQDDFVIVTQIESSAESADSEKEEMFRKLEMELQKQIEMCQRNKDHFLKLGDVSSASKFEKYVIDSRKDLDMLRNHWRNGDKVPRFCYETRSFSIVICNSDIANTEAYVEVVKAIDIPRKDDFYIYAKIKFPFPNDTPQFGKTQTVKCSLTAVFNETFKFEIDRKSRQLPRVFKRHPIEIQLFAKGGFLRSDSLLGTASVKLTDLETKCTIHDSYLLMEGRKAVGGRVEAIVKLREPLLAKQVEEVKEKWLVFS